jgi:hypothetical protein
MPDDILGGQGATLLMAIAIVAVALLALAAAFWLIKARSSSTFIRGGRARQPRLAVLDAAAVDTRRRIVLIRRDDVEHLVMIGGPTDVVIESRIVHSDDPAGTPAHNAGPESEDPAPASNRLPPDLMATAKSIAQSAQASTRNAQPEPSPSSAPAAPLAAGAAATAAAATASGGAPASGSIETEAADILESARARVFDEAGSRGDGPAMETPGAPGPAAAKTKQAMAAPPAYEEVLAGHDSSAPSWPDAGETVQPAPQPKPAAPAEPGLDFESVLAAELSEDLSLDPFDDGFIDDLDDTPDQQAKSEPTAAPEVQSDARPSRDSLEAEMERLLGDMTRKP